MKLEWTEIKTIDDLPKKPNNGRYEQIDCLIAVDGSVLRSVWNCEHRCWDDDHGDDFMFEKMHPYYWMLMTVAPMVDDK